MYKMFCDACSCSVLHTHYIALINTKAENLSLSWCGTVGNLVKLEQAVATKLAICSKINIKVYSILLSSG